MIFGMDVMPLRPTLNSHFQIPLITNTNMADERKREVRSTLALLTARHKTLIKICNGILLFSENLIFQRTHVKTVHSSLDYTFPVLFYVFISVQLGLSREGKVAD